MLDSLPLKGGGLGRVGEGVSVRVFQYAHVYDPHPPAFVLLWRATSPFQGEVKPGAEGQ